MILLFIAITKAMKYNECQSIDFCRRKFNSTEQFTLSNEIFSFNETHAIFSLINRNTSQRAKIIISYPKGIGIRIRGEDFPHSPNDLPNRFDLSEESSVFNQGIFSSFEKIFISSQTKDQLLLNTENNIKIQLYANPFTIEILQSNKIIAVFNHNSQILFTSNTINETEINDEFKSVVGSDIFINGENMHFSGLGSCSNSLNLDDSIYRLFNTDDRTKCSSVPFIMSHSSTTNPIGLFWSNPSDTFIQCKNGSVRFLSETGHIDLFIYLGSFDDIISKYSNTTGRPYFPPIFSLGYHQSRESYQSQNEVNTIMTKLAMHDIPFDSIYLGRSHFSHNDPFQFNITNFPEPKKLVGKMIVQDKHLIRLSNPSLPITAPYVEEHLTNEEFFVHDDNITHSVTTNDNIELVFPDFLNPEVQKWWSHQFSYNVALSNQNVFYCTDLCEGSADETNLTAFPKELKHFGDRENREIHNIYSLLATSSTFEGLLTRNQRNKLRPFVVTSSQFPGIQKYGFSWTTNVKSTWNSMKKSIPNIISYGISGIPFIGCDIGGFHGSPSDELMIRWFQLASWTYPFFREHSSNSSQNREPYTFQSDTFKFIQESIKTRYSHLLVWYNQARNANLYGTPLVKPLWSLNHHDVNDSKINEIYHTIDDQVIVLDSFMIAPILNERQYIRPVYKPPGRWYCYPSGFELSELITNFSVEIKSTPTFMMGGKIIAVYTEIGKSAIETLGKKEIDLYLSLDENDEAYGEIYIDDGLSYMYKDGSYFKATISFKNEMIRITTEGTSTESDNFNKELRIKHLYFFGLSKPLKNIGQYQGKEIGYRNVVEIPDLNPLLINSNINLEVVLSATNKVRLATFIIGSMLVLAIVAISVILPIVIYRKIKNKNKDKENTNDQNVSPLLDETEI